MVHYGEGLLTFGHHSDYEGDNPWWTIRFREPVTAAQKTTLSKVVDKGFELSWTKGPLAERQCQFAPVGDPYFESEEGWINFYSEVERLFGQVSATAPVFAILLQKGQFFAGEFIDGWTDEELRKHHAAGPSS